MICTGQRSAASVTQEFMFSGTMSSARFPANRNFSITWLNESSGFSSKNSGQVSQQVNPSLNVSDCRIIDVAADQAHIEIHFSHELSSGISNIYESIQIIYYLTVFSSFRFCNKEFFPGYSPRRFRHGINTNRIVLSEKQVLSKIQKAGLPLPDSGQKIIAEGDEMIARADFAYTKGGHSIVLFIDGPTHDTESQKRDDAAKRDRLDLMGYVVFVIRYDDIEQKIRELETVISRT